MNSCVQIYHGKLRKRETKKLHSKFIKTYLESKFYANIGWLSPDDNWSSFYSIQRLVPFLDVSSGKKVIQFLKRYPSYRIKHIKELVFVVETKIDKDTIDTFVSNAQFKLPLITVDIVKKSKTFWFHRLVPVHNVFRRHDYIHN